MQRTDFHFELPEELIAQRPVTPRSASRLLKLDGGAGDLKDLEFCDFPGLLTPADLLVFNDTRVVPARIHGAKDSGGRIPTRRREPTVETRTAQPRAAAQ